MAKKKKRTPNFLAKLKKGAYHRQLGISEDKPIPVAQARKDTHSLNPKTRLRANFALVSRTWSHARGKRKKK